MESSPTYFDPKILSTVEGLQVRAKRIVEGYVAGLHRSPFRGFSIEFSEHREYTPGDDLRYLDWKVLGRTDKHYVKQFEDETNLIAYLALDSSESMDFRSDDGLTKYDYAATLATCIAWLVLRQQDAVALATFDQSVTATLRPATGGPHINEIVKILEIGPQQSKTSLGSVMSDLSERFKRRGITFFISDFFDDVDSIAEGVRYLKTQRHDVVLVQIVDPAEIDFPFDRPTRFTGLEGLAPLVADPVSLRQSYVAEFERFLGKIEALARSLQVEHHLIRTDAPFDRSLQRVLRSRA